MIKTLRSLLVPVLFLVVGGVAVGIGGRFVNISSIASWITAQVGSLVPWVGDSAGGESGYVAVYLSGGKVYFGKLKDARSDAPTLTDVFFLSVSEARPASSSEPPPDEAEGATVEPAQQLDYELVKLTDQLQKPSDELLLSRDQILFWEPLRPDSRVVQAIEKYHEQSPKN